jgi:hypothetical protein
MVIIQRKVAIVEKEGQILAMKSADRFFEIVYRDSVVTPFAVISGKLGEQGVLWCASMRAKSLINDLLSFSQAGRYGFDPRLPLHISEMKA